MKQEIYILRDDSGERPAIHSRKSLHQHIDLFLDNLQDQGELAAEDVNIEYRLMTQAELDAAPAQ